MNEQLNQIASDVGELRRTLDKNLQDALTTEKVEKMCEDIVNRLHPAKPEQKGIPAIEAIQEKHKLFNGSSKKLSGKFAEYGTFNDFLRHVVANPKGYMVHNQKTGTYLAEGTDADGGYLVPTEYSNQIFDLLYGDTIINQIANILPMSTWKRRIPKVTSNATVYWLTEHGTKTTSTPQFGAIDQQAKVMATIVKLTDEILRDSSIDLQAWLAKATADDFAREIEKIALVGNVSSTGDSFNGVLSASGTNVVSLEGATLSYDDIINLTLNTNMGYNQGAKIVMNRTSLKKIMKLKDSDGQYIWHSPMGSVPGSISAPGAQYPYLISEQIPNTIATSGTARTGGSHTAIIFGNFNRFLLVSPREEIKTLVSQTAYDGTDNAFTMDMTFLRFTHALSIDVAVPAAFSYLKFAA